MSDATPVRRPWPTSPQYSVGDDGTFYGPYGCPRKCYTNDGGYMYVSVRLDGRTRNFRLSRVVCEAWHGPAPSPEHQAAHEDGDKSNNRPDNLSWKTYAENADDARRHYREGKYGEVGPATRVSCKLTSDDVREIRASRAAGVSCAALAERYGVVSRSIWAILRGETYAWVD